jgi:tripartite-type tricarboxylate transporter receptor subunit TctC
MIRTFLCTLISLIALVAQSAFAADPYPARPIRMIVGYAAGGAADAAARHLATLVSKRLGQNIVVENRPGASGSIAAATVASSPADGYTLLYATSDLVLYPLLTGNTTFAPLRDFVPVIGVSRRPLLLVTTPSLGFKSARDLVAAAKAKPATITFESSGVGSVEHLAGHLFQKLTATELVHVPYKGSAPGILALLGGQVQIGFEVPLGVLDHVKAGKLVALLTTSGERLASLPSVPTAKEEGLPALDIRAPWGGIFAPAGTPSDRIAKLNAEFVAARTAPETMAHAIFAETISLAGTPDTFGAFVRADYDRWAALIREAGLRLNP